MSTGNQQVGELVEKKMKDDKLYVLNYANPYENSLHEIDKRSVMAFKNVIKKYGIEYKILIDLHDSTQPSKRCVHAIESLQSKYLADIGWAPVYIDNDGDIVFTWHPHFVVSVSEYNQPILMLIKKYLFTRQGDIPPYVSEIDQYRNSINYMKWYRGWEKSKLCVIPAGITLSDLSPDYELGNNHVIIEFLPKVDLLTPEQKNGNLHKITIEDGFLFVKNMIDYFIENSSRDF